MIYRENLGFLLNYHGLTGNGLELGVQKGEFSKRLLSTWTGKKLFLIDCWEKQNNYDDIANVSSQEQIQNYNTTVKNVSEFSKRTKIIKKFSADAANDFEDNFFDFIYLDGDHSYEGVKKDLEIWYPKLKNGGLFCGHDFIDGKVQNTETGQYLGDFGVKSAVLEFARNYGYEVSKSLCSSWYFFKSKKPKIGFLNTYDQNYKKVADLFRHNKMEYCVKNGYDYLEVVREAYPNKHAAYNKFLVTLEYLPYYDWIFYNDVDSIIMNQNIKLESLLDENYKFIISYDINGLNSGMWFAKNSTFANNFLVDCFEKSGFENYKGWADQISLANCYLYSGEAMQNIKLVQQAQFNSYIYDNFYFEDTKTKAFYPQGKYKTGQFMLHLCGMDYETRNKYAQELLPQVLR